MTATQTRLVTPLAELVAGVRTAVEAHASWSETAQLVAEQLRRHLPAADVLRAEQRSGSPDGYRSHTLHVEPDGSFSIIALVWRPGQVTRIHDHTTWCAFGVIQGAEHEDLFDADLNLIGQSDNHAGEVSGFVPSRRWTTSTGRSQRHRLEPQPARRLHDCPVQARGLARAGRVHAPLQHEVGDVPDESEGVRRDRTRQAGARRRPDQRLALSVTVA